MKMEEDGEIEGLVRPLMVMEIGAGKRFEEVMFTLFEEDLEQESWFERVQEIVFRANYEGKVTRM